MQISARNQLKGTVKHVTPGMSEMYQQAAAVLARRMKIDRVHLDTYLWVEGR